MLMMLTGMCFAQDFEKVRAEHILVKTSAEAIQIKKLLMTGQTLNIMQERTQFVLPLKRR